MADESDIITSTTDEFPVVSEAQRSDLGNLVAMKKVIDNLKGSGQKALTDFYKELMAFTLTFKLSVSLDDNPPKYMLVLHATLELVKDRNPKELLLVLTNSEYYSMWECSEITDLQFCRLTRKWGSAEFWGDEVDMSSHMLGDAVFVDVEKVKGLEELMTTTWEKVRPKKPLSLLPTPPVVEVRISTLQLQLKTANEVLVARELEFNRVSLALHIAKGGTRETFVPPHPQSYVNMGGGGPPAPTAMDPVALLTSPTIRDFFTQMVADQVASQVAIRLASLSAGGPSSSSSSAPTTINVAAQLTESKRQNFLRVEQIKPLFDVDEFEAAWKALDTDLATGKPTSYNMEFAQNHVREIVTADLGHNAQEPTRLFLTNASLFNFGTGAEGLSLDDFLGPKERIGNSSAKFTLALMAVRNLYGAYFGSKMEIVMAIYCCDVTNLLLRHQGVPIRAMVHFVERTLAKLRQIGPCSHKVALQHMKDTLKVDRTAQDFRDLLDQLMYGETQKESRKRDREEDDDPTRLLSPTSRKKPAGGGPNEAPPLSGPIPCYGWILRRCSGAVCTVAKNRRRGPNPHEWDAADDGTPAARAFEKWVKTNKGDWKKN